MPLIPSLGQEVGRPEFEPAWSIQQDPGQPRLHKETLAGGRGAVFQVPLWNAAF